MFTSMHLAANAIKLRQGTASLLAQFGQFVHVQFDQWVQSLVSRTFPAPDRQSGGSFGFQPIQSICEGMRLARWGFDPSPGPASLHRLVTVLYRCQRCWHAMLSDQYSSAAAGQCAFCGASPLSLNRTAKLIRFFAICKYFTNFFLKNYHFIYK